MINHLSTRAPWFRLGRHEGEGGEGGAGAGAAGEGGAGAGEGAGGAGAGEGGQGEPKTFTQAELDRIVGDRLSRQKAQYGDYDALKDKAGKFDELEAANKTELEREREARATAEANATKATEMATETLRRSAVISEAAKAGAVDPEAVYALLEDRASLVVEDGKVTGAADAVAALLEAKAYLKAPAADGRPTGDASQGVRNGEPIDMRVADDATYKAEMAKLGIRR